MERLQGVQVLFGFSAPYSYSYIIQVCSFDMMYWRLTSEKTFMKYYISNSSLVIQIQKNPRKINAIKQSAKCVKLKAAIARGPSTTAMWQIVLHCQCPAVIYFATVRNLIMIRCFLFFIPQNKLWIFKKKKNTIQCEYLSCVLLNISLFLIQQHFSTVIASPRQEDISDQVLQAASETCLIYLAPVLQFINETSVLFNPTIYIWCWRKHFPTETVHFAEQKVM